MANSIRNTYLPLDDSAEDNYSLDDYRTEDEKLEDIVRSTASYRGQAYSPDTDDSALYDDGWDTAYGYEG